MLGQFVAHRETMHAALAGQLVELVEFQPKPSGTGQYNWLARISGPHRLRIARWMPTASSCARSRLLRGASWTTISL